MSMDAFDHVFAVLIGAEGGFTDNPEDPGNWTGGRIGAGACRGTKYGVSAASYPTLDIARLTLDAAKAIYKRDYWDVVRGDDLPPGIAMLAFDAAVNNGVGRARRWLQQSAGVTADGVLGAVSLAAVRRADEARLMVEFHAQRLAFMAGLETWRTFGLGWARRLCRLMLEAARLQAMR